MIPFFDEHGLYREYPESQSCRFQPVTILGQSMNPHTEASDEETKGQRQEETWKVALEGLQHGRTSQVCWDLEIRCQLSVRNKSMVDEMPVSVME